MHYYIKRDGKWVVEFHSGDGVYRLIRIFDSEVQAAAYVNYLNGGEGRPCPWFQ